jgi:hypothetical protein
MPQQTLAIKEVDYEQPASGAGLRHQTRLGQGAGGAHTGRTCRP